MMLRLAKCNLHELMLPTENLSVQDTFAMDASVFRYSLGVPAVD